MLYSPKPDLIFDASANSVGVKNQDNELEIYANKMPAFNRLYWANWFGQKDSVVYPLKDNNFVTNYGQKIIINDENFVKSQKCEEAEIYINVTRNSKCYGSLITVNKDFLDKIPIILIFCNSKECQIKTGNTNNRFK